MNMARANGREQEDGMTPEQREAIDNLTNVLDEYRPRAIRAEKALREIARMMDEDELDAYRSRNESGFPSDYWDALGNRDDAFHTGKRVGRSEAADVAREALSAIREHRVGGDDG